MTQRSCNLNIPVLKRTPLLIPILRQINPFRLLYRISLGFIGVMSYLRRQYLTTVFGCKEGARFFSIQIRTEKQMGIIFLNVHIFTEFDWLPPKRLEECHTLKSF
jgi:hypothetical protein